MADANTAHLDRWGRPAWAGPHHDNFDSRRDWRPGFHPGRIILIVAGFIGIVAHLCRKGIFRKTLRACCSCRGGRSLGGNGARVSPSS